MLLLFLLIYKSIRLRKEYKLFVKLNLSKNVALQQQKIK